MKTSLFWFTVTTALLVGCGGGNNSSSSQDSSQIDSDNDGLSDYVEIHHWQTDPSKKDTDDDGVSDGLEILTFETDPNSADSHPPILQYMQQSFEDGLDESWSIARDNTLSGIKLSSNSITGVGRYSFYLSTQAQVPNSLQYTGFFARPGTVYFLIYGDFDRGGLIEFLVNDEVFYAKEVSELIDGSSFGFDNPSFSIASGFSRLHWRFTPYNSSGSESAIRIDEVWFLPDGDLDNDGIDGHTEYLVGLDDEDPTDAFGDEDADGLNNIEEVRLGTDLHLPDTDADGLSDFDEANEHGTDPLANDSDLDKLLDGEEINEFGTMALDVDSDEDGYSDFQEVHQLLTDPLDPASRAEPLVYYFESFESEQIPPKWRLIEGSNTLELVTHEAADGLQSLAINVAEYGRLQFSQDFNSGELTISLQQETLFCCFSVFVLVDGREVGIVRNVGWNSFTFEVPPGVHNIDIKFHGLQEPHQVMVDRVEFRSLEDNDQDGIVDYWEGKYGLDPENSDDATTDADNDGLTNWQEFEQGTHPSLADSDGDGLGDGAEVNEWFTDPTRDADFDQDGLSDAQEIILFNTDPNRQDTDLDGLSDSAEGLFYLTDGRDAQSLPETIYYFNEDFETNSIPEGWRSINSTNSLSLVPEPFFGEGAGLSATFGEDGRAVIIYRNFLDSGSITFNALPLGDQTCCAKLNFYINDELVDELSLQNALAYTHRIEGGDVTFKWELLNPLELDGSNGLYIDKVEYYSLSDVDNDGLNGGEEIIYGTDHFNPDSDGDGLDDGREVDYFKTNPTLADTDGDGLADGKDFFDLGLSYLQNENCTVCHDYVGEGRFEGPIPFGVNNPISLNFSDRYAVGGYLAGDSLHSSFFECDLLCLDSLSEFFYELYLTY